MILVLVSQQERAFYETGSMDEDTHSTLNDKQKTRLLSFGYLEEGSNQGTDSNAVRIDALYRILIVPLPLPPDTMASIPDVLRSMASELESVSGKPIGRLLQDDDTPLKTLEQIKVISKYRGRHATVDSVKDAYMAIYFAAIARAIALYDVTISQHSPSKLAQFFQAYIKEHWVLDELKDVFETACLRLKRQARSTENDR